jgi:hypothetical protein
MDVSRVKCWNQVDFWGKDRLLQVCFDTITLVESILFDIFSIANATICAILQKIQLFSRVGVAVQAVFNVFLFGLRLPPFL